MFLDHVYFDANQRSPLNYIAGKIGGVNYEKLYLYFNAAKNDTTFFPRFFQLMYDEPFTKRTKAQGVTYGETDYLKFAVNVCKAANMDLSDFFEWYGFFTPINNREIGDYANYVLTTTQAMIDKAKAEMKKYPKAGAAPTSSRLTTPPKSSQTISVSSPSIKASST